ncbi:hypothetical protein N7462_009044 [Penicillium macrosclerotiorum]|uniref:uncharacterized protein n=1 Tax=Penicillium macrosclerotiorum TaxID=303699 RepID=UPI002548326A|nr:uncharacterized protein N7462_009044 [Penicillium macrosclerotiorum]KAJ5676147.1 hypothetical protein N7462_009044 [Penicillium macrosclerotiorum]
MGFFDHDSEEYRHHDEMTNRPHEAKWSHELIGGAAAYEAMKAYEEHEARNGKIDEHAKAKEVVAGLIGAFVDREVETKGLDFIDREKAKHHARERAEASMNNSGRW